MRKALKISKELGNKIFMAHASYNLGITLQDMGRGLFRGVQNSPHLCL